MDRTAWLQDRRLKKFLEVLGCYERRKLSALEAGEILGCPERQFRRWRDWRPGTHRSTLLIPTSPGSVLVENGDAGA